MWTEYKLNANSIDSRRFLITIILYWLCLCSNFSSTALVPARYILSILGSVAMAIVYGLKVNLSVALVAMLNHTELHRISQGPQGIQGLQGPQGHTSFVLNNVTQIANATFAALVSPPPPPLDACSSGSVDSATVEVIIYLCDSLFNLKWLNSHNIQFRTDHLLGAKVSKAAYWAGKKHNSIYSIESTMTSSTTSDHRIISVLFVSAATSGATLYRKCRAHVLLRVFRPNGSCSSRSQLTSFAPCWLRWQPNYIIRQWLRCELAKVSAAVLPSRQCTWCWLLGRLRLNAVPCRHWCKLHPAYDDDDFDNLMNCFGIFSYAGTALGTVLSMLSAGLLAGSFGWESVFYVMGAVSSVWIVLWIWLVQDTPSQQSLISQEERDFINTSLGSSKSEHDDVKPPVPWRRVSRVRIWGYFDFVFTLRLSQVLTSLPFLAILVAHTCSNWGWYMMLIELPFYMKQVLKFNIKENALGTSLPFLTLWLFSMALSKTLDILRARGTISTTLARKIATLCASFVPMLCLFALCYIGCQRTLAVIIMGLGMNLRLTNREKSFQLSFLITQA